MEKTIALNDDNAKIYELIFERKDGVGDFIYWDFIRPTDRAISVVKNEIRSYIAHYQMDKKVEELVRNSLDSKVLSSKDKRIAVRVAWLEDVKLPVLLAVGVYEHN